MGIKRIEKIRNEEIRARAANVTEKIKEAEKATEEEDYEETKHTLRFERTNDCFYTDIHFRRPMFKYWTTQLYADQMALFFLFLLF